MKEAKMVQFIWNPKAPDEYPTREDILYILNQFMKAVKKRGLVCGGGIHPAEEKE